MEKSPKNIDSQLNSLKLLFGSSSLQEDSDSEDDAPSFLNQMSLYQSNEINNKINKMRDVCEKQQKLHNTLNTKETDDKIKKITTFYEKNKDNIEEQLNVLNKLNKDIIEITDKNEKLQQDDEQINQLLNSKEYKDLEKKIKLIRGNIEGIEKCLEKKNVNY